MPATPLDIGDPSLALPEFLILDASVILELVLLAKASRPTSRMLTVKRFMTRVSDAARRGQMHVLLPIEALEECYFKLCRGEIEALAQATSGARTASWSTYYKQNPRVMRQMAPLYSRLRGMLEAVPVDVIEPEDIAVSDGRCTPLSVRMADWSLSYYLLPKDALILTVADRLGIYTVATLDHDWERADGFTVITPV